MLAPQRGIASGIRIGPWVEKRRRLWSAVKAFRLPAA
jgi:hypothetical protein